ncbi:MAG: hypothetical protein KJ720_02975 [Proteobacteria bacterium]|nr:hypothetical protein [Pseudomonadota bacterium]MBU1450303.1 hypothetical protein [Pseudomonadota bacterium]MBU2468295.1 hypothetical protein [Pseudomonadota bacterium]MBU2518585.1 hypothetical protein [Pseudomonadota bacterium]
MLMRSLLACGLVLGLLAMLCGCASSLERMSTRGSAPLDPGSNIMVADARCGDVVAVVRKKLRGDSSFGSAQEMGMMDGARLVLPWKRDGKLRRRATVVVECFDKDKLTSRVTVEVQAQRQKKDGSWEYSSDTGGLAEQVLKALYPLP